jgi:hypothetical protein
VCVKAKDEVTVKTEGDTGRLEQQKMRHSGGRVNHAGMT